MPQALPRRLPQTPRACEPSESNYWYWHLLTVLISGDQLWLARAVVWIRVDGCGPNRLVGTCAQSVPCAPLLHDGRNHRVISRLVHLLLLRKSATSCIDQHANAPGHKSVRQVQNQAAAIRRRRCFCRTSSNGQKSRISTVSTQLSPSVTNSGSYQSLVVPTAP